MPNMKNPEVEETMEMSTEELVESMHEGKVSTQQQNHHADGTVTSSDTYGNDIGDGIDRSLIIFGTARDIMIPTIQAAKKIVDADKDNETLFYEPLFYMDDSDVDYEVTIEDTALPMTHIVSCTKEGVTIYRYLRPKRKPYEGINILFENGEIKATVEDMHESSSLVMFAFAVNELRKILRERGILQELQRIGNKSSGVLVTAVSVEEDIDVRIVRGKERPDLPCGPYRRF